MNSNQFKISFNWFHIVSLTLVFCIVFELSKQHAETQKLNSIISEVFESDEIFSNHRLSSNTDLINKLLRWKDYPGNISFCFQQAQDHYIQLSSQVRRNINLRNLIHIDSLTHSSYSEIFYATEDSKYYRDSTNIYKKKPFSLYTNNYKKFIQYTLNKNYEQIFNYYLMKYSICGSCGLYTYDISAQWLSGNHIPLGKEFNGVIYLSGMNPVNLGSILSPIYHKDLILFVNGIELESDQEGSFPFSEVPKSSGVQHFEVEAYWKSRPNIRYQDVFTYYVR